MPDPLGPINAGRRGGLSFQLGPIPVTIHISFLLVMGFLGITLGDPLLIGVWLVVGAASVLLHELGHAIAARMAGFEPRVELAGMGGVTTYRGERSRGWSLFITAAGPGLQIVAGLAALPFVPGVGIVYRGDLVEFALSVWVVVSLFWGVLNLVPILPLDGGQLFRNLVPGGPDTRTRVAEVVSVAMAGVGMVWALLSGLTIAALLAGWFGFANLQSVLSGRERRSGTSTVALVQRAQDHFGAGEYDEAADLAGRAAQRDTADTATRTMAGSLALASRLRAGRSRDAYRMVADPRHDLAFNEVLVAHALAAHPNRPAVQRVLDAGRASRDEARPRGITAIVALLHGHPSVADDVLATGPVSPAVTREVERIRAARHA
ncbi:site-2 protease family protein [Salsipaludibacter albus]|uniref:site-2 protease family protein n=1 Tax=Salsipaludibacter albus TaxID=2849650 RepID=UPI001EE3BB6C|nr:site-2 protease family protein [Salsipaludibacter albus]MBY5162744.1 hypothetical protein [Salsipaludibacter albus]